MAKIFDYIANKNSLYSEIGVLGVVTGSLVHTKCNKGWYLPCTGSKYITFTLPSLQQKSIITVTKVNNNYIVTQTNTTATINSLVLNNANYLRYIIYDSVASATSDLKNIQSWVNSLQPLTYQKRLLQLPKPTELKQQGLIAAYNMKPVGGVLHDISGNGNNIVITNLYTTNKGMKYIQSILTSNTSTTLNITNATINYRLNVGKAISTSLFSFLGIRTYYIVFSNTSFSIYDGGTWYTIVSGLKMNTLSNTITITLTSSTKLLTIYLNGVQIGTYTLKGVAPTQITNILGNNNVTSLQVDSEYVDIRIYNRVLSTQEIKAYHNSFNEITLQESFDDMAVGSSKLPNGWIKSGGSFVCGENTTNDSVIKSIRKRGKYLKCNTAGIVAIPCKQAYGIWKFTIYYTGAGSQFNFVSNSISGLTSYNIYLSTTGRVQIRKETANLAYTDVGYITNNNHYEFTVERVNNGDIYLYIQGGIYTSKILVSMTNGSGSNPTNNTLYTTSNYVSFVANGANNRITGILIQSQIRV